MGTANIDLLLGGPLGRWALARVEPGTVGRVYTHDEALASDAEHLGFEVAHRVKPEGGGAALALSVHYPHILSPEVLGRYRGVYNLHPGLLPWGRGFYPVFWAMWEGTPAGATLHRMAEKVDAGPIVDQIGVEVHPDDTGESLHQRVTDAEQALFLRHWQALVEGKLLATTAQPPGGSYHSRQEFLRLKQDPPWRELSGEQIVRLARALTFTGFSGLELAIGGRRFELLLRTLDAAR